MRNRSDRRAPYPHFVFTKPDPLIVISGSDDKHDKNGKRRYSTFCPHELQNLPETGV
jgi:hypothetical protein